MPETIAETASPLDRLEHRLRPLVPADLYATAWLNPSPAVLLRLFDHLRTLHRILQNHVPRPVAERPPRLGYSRHEWKEGTLLCTDLVGFTPLLESYFAHGDAGARALLEVLNLYFAQMIEIIARAGGDLIEYAGDAMVAQFERDRRGNDTAQAVRAALRMQRIMHRFASAETDYGPLSLGMRIGIHSGRYLAADSGTPRRMEHWLLGHTVLQAKQAERYGHSGRVCLSPAAAERVQDKYRFEPAADGHHWIVDDLTPAQLGRFDVTPTKRVLSTPLLAKRRSVEGLVGEIERALNLIEPLASYLPREILTVLVENAAERRIAPDFPRPTVMLINVAGMMEAVDFVQPRDLKGLLSHYTHLFALVNAIVESRGGVLTSATYHLTGSGLVASFGVPNAHFNDPLRAAATALTIRDAIHHLEPPRIVRKFANVACRIGIARGPVFAAEIGQPHGRRQFNIIGDTVNTAARFMGQAEPDQILVSEAVRAAIAEQFECDPIGALNLKGKSTPVPVHQVLGRRAA